MVSEGARGNQFFVPELAELGHSFDPSGCKACVRPFTQQSAQMWRSHLRSPVMILLERVRASLIMETKQNRNGSGRRSARGKDATKYGFLNVETNPPIRVSHVRSLVKPRRGNSTQPASRRAGKNTLTKPDV